MILTNRGYFLRWSSTKQFSDILYEIQLRYIWRRRIELVYSCIILGLYWKVIGFSGKFIELVFQSYRRIFKRLFNVRYKEILNTKGRSDIST